MTHMHSAIGDLSCYITIIYKLGQELRIHGVREPDHAILSNLLFPYTHQDLER